MKPSFNDSQATIKDLLPICLFALQILDRLDSAPVSNPPSLLTVFRLYCAQRLTVREVAAQCRCSTGTISQRLGLMRSLIGIHPSRIRNAPRPGDSHALQSFQNEHRNRP